MTGSVLAVPEPHDHEGPAAAVMDYLTSWSITVIAGPPGGAPPPHTPSVNDAVEGRPGDRGIGACLDRIGASPPRMR